MKQNKKKIVAVGATGLLASGLLLGSVEYATHTFAATRIMTTNAAKVTEKTDAKDTAKKSGKVSKEETVYATLDATGNKEKVVVSDWLKNSGVQKDLEDESELKDIVNTKGNETFTQDDKNLTWKAEKNDIYYQGSTDKELPVGIEISYKLDGEEIAAEELAGKSGKLEMKITYTNSAESTVKIDGKERTIYTPFLMATGMILPVEKFTNVSIDNGLLVSEGDNDMVIGYGMPGLKESLDLDNLDLGKDISIDKIKDKITDTVTIKADVKDFSMGQTYTVATSSIFRELDMDKISSEQLSDKLDDLKDATKELVSGTGDLKKGLSEMKSAFKKYSDAIHTLDDSVGALHDGSTKIKAGVNAYTSANDKLLGAVTEYVDGSKTFAGSTKKYTAGTKKLVDAVGKMYDGTKEFPANYKQFNESLKSYTTGVNTLLAEENMTALTNGVSQLKTGAQTINGYAKKIEATEETAQVLKALDAIKSDYAKRAQDAETQQEKAQYQQLAAAAEGAKTYMQGAQQVAAGIDAATNGKADGEADKNGAADLTAGLSQLSQKAGVMAESAKTIRTYQAPLLKASGTINAGISDINKNLNLMYKSGNQLTANNTKLNSAADKLSTNAGKVKENAVKLTKKSDDLRDAAKKMTEGTKALVSGVNTLVGKTGDVTEGIGKLSSGSIKLYNGVLEFEESGVKKLTDKVRDLFDSCDDLTERIDELNTLSDNYKSFSGISKQMDGKVKFILTTKEIKTADE